MHAAGGPALERAESTRALCLSCHNGVVATDAQTSFTASTNPLTHHDIAPGGSLGCTSCHTPHRSDPQHKFIDPDQPAVLQGSALASLITTEGSVFVLVGSAHDGAAPVISGLTVDSSADGTAPVIRWTTNEVASSWIDWGLTSAYELGSETTGTPFGNATLTTAHTLQFTGLAPGVAYHFRVRSADAAGNSSCSADQAYTAYVTVPHAYVAIESTLPAAPSSTATPSAEASSMLEPEPSPVAWLYPHASLTPSPQYSVDTDRIAVRLTQKDGTVRDLAPAAGWESAGPGTALPTLAAPGTPAEAATLATAATADGLYWRTAVAVPDREWDWQVVRFDPGTDVATTKSLMVTWTGHGEATAGYPTALWIWDASSGWTQIANRDIGTDTSVASAQASVAESFCLSCHDGSGAGTITMPSSTANMGPTWPTDVHGAAGAVGFGGDALKSPFARQSGAIPCTVCHDTHGTASVYHVPAAVNGTAGIAAQTGAELRTLCAACHDGTLPDWHRPCVDCHSGGHWAGYVDPPVESYLPTEASDCTQCHGHGKSWTHPATCLRCHGVTELKALGTQPDQPWTYQHTF